jgi:hypothetical protein
MFVARAEAVNGAVMRTVLPGVRRLGVADALLVTVNAVAACAGDAFGATKLVNRSARIPVARTAQD